MNRRLPSPDKRAFIQPHEVDHKTYEEELRELEYETNKQYLDAIKVHGRFSNDLFSKEDKINRAYRRKVKALMKKHGREDRYYLETTKP